MAKAQVCGPIFGEVSKNLETSMDIYNQFLYVTRSWSVAAVNNTGLIKLPAPVPVSARIHPIRNRHFAPLKGPHIVAG